MISIEKADCRACATRSRVYPLFWGIVIVLYSYGIGAVFAYVGFSMSP